MLLYITMVLQLLKLSVAGALDHLIRDRLFQLAISLRLLQGVVNLSVFVVESECLRFFARNQDNGRVLFPMYLDLDLSNLELELFEALEVTLLGTLHGDNGA